MVEVGGDRATSSCRGGGEGVVRTRRVVNRRSEVPLAWLLSIPPLYPSPSSPLSSRGGRKTVKVKLISEICRNGAFLKDRAMFSLRGRKRERDGGGGGVFDRCGHLDREINFLTLLRHPGLIRVGMISRGFYNVLASQRREVRVEIGGRKLQVEKIAYLGLVDQSRLVLLKMDIRYDR